MIEGGPEPGHHLVAIENCHGHLANGERVNSTTPTSRIRALNVSPRLFALVPVAVAINLVVGTVVKELSLPIYLDTLGTILVAVLAGMTGGWLVGTISQLLMGLLTGYQYLPFVVIQWLIVLVALAAARRHGFAGLWRSLGWGVLCGVAGGSLSAVISYFFFGGVTGGGVTVINTLLVSAGVKLGAAVTIGSVGTDVLDKAIAFVLVGALLRGLPRRILGRYPRAAVAAGK